MKRIVMPLAASFAAAGILIAGALPASAYDPGVTGTYTGSGINIRTCAHLTGCAILGEGYPTQTPCINSVWPGDYVMGNNSWYYHENLSTGIIGYSTAYYIAIPGDSQDCTFTQ